MPTNIDKIWSDVDANQALYQSYNQVDASLTTNGFLIGKVGNKITQTISTTTIANDTSTFNFYCDFTTLLYTYVLIFTDGTQSTLLSATRTA